MRIVIILSLILFSLLWVAYRTHQWEGISISLSDDCSKATAANEDAMYTAVEAAGAALQYQSDVATLVPHPTKALIAKVDKAKLHAIHLLHLAQKASNAQYAACTGKNADSAPTTPDTIDPGHSVIFT